MPMVDTNRPITDIFRDLLTQLTSLVRTEGELARAEMNEKIDRAARGLALMVGGAALLIPALVILLAAAVAAIMDTGLEPYWAALIVGGAALAVGVILMVAGKSSIKLNNLAPRKTVHQLRRDVSVAKQQMRQT
jgi:uncharacterized membrane protein YqjE